MNPRGQLPQDCRNLRKDTQHLSAPFVARILNCREPEGRVTQMADTNQIAAMFEPLLAASIINQDATHCFSRGGKEVPTILPTSGIGSSNQSQVGFVN